MLKIMMEFGQFWWLTHPELSEDYDPEMADEAFSRSYFIIYDFTIFDSVQ